MKTIARFRIFEKIVRVREDREGALHIEANFKFHEDDTVGVSASGWVILMRMGSPFEKADALNNITVRPEYKTAITIAKNYLESGTESLE